MLNSMTGFASRQAEIPSFGKVNIELRSSNHKFLDLVFHLPDGFLSLEDRIKKEIGAKLKRGRVTCVISIISQQAPLVFVNENVLKNYLKTLKKIKRGFKIKDDLRLDTLIHLPGVLSLVESRVPKERIWPKLNVLVNGALADLLKMRQKEGRALAGYLKNRAQTLEYNLTTIRRKSKQLIAEECRQLKTDEERTAFLKESDITEELERLAFHIRNFKNKLSGHGAAGKELDFIAQEMQREANTMGAKSFNALISTKVVQIKSQIEKIREQVQNIE